MTIRDSDAVICRRCGEEVHKDRTLPVIPDEDGNMTYTCEDCLEAITKDRLERLREMGFKQEVEAVERGLCPFCKTPVKESDFTDYRSRLDFKVTGMCKECQDDFLSNFYYE